MSRHEHAKRKRRESLSKRLGVIVRAIHARDGHACVYCGATAETSGAHLHLDHLTPKSRGGLDVPTNLVLACRTCNSARHDLSLAAWCALRGGRTSRQIRNQAKRVLRNRRAGVDGSVSREL